VLAFAWLGLGLFIGAAIAMPVCTLSARGVGRWLAVDEFPAAGKQSQPVNIDLVEDEILKLTNLARTAEGLPPLQGDTALSRVARGHSRDMAALDFFAHDDPNGRTPSMRAQAAGYSCKRETHVGVAENIIKLVTYKYGLVGDTRLYLGEPDVAFDAVESWLKSAGHRENIMDPEFDLVGTGAALGSDDWLFVTQNFC
jgi:uncharacterized protein YkwD